MTLKNLLEKDFGVQLPISGGFGNSIDNAIIIHKDSINDYVGTEHFILECLGKGRQIEWKILGQELHNHNNKKIDKQIKTHINKGKTSEGINGRGPQGRCFPQVFKFHLLTLNFLFLPNKLLSRHPMIQLYLMYKYLHSLYLPSLHNTLPDLFLYL